MRSIVKNILNVLTKKEKQRFWCLAILDILVSTADILFLASLLWIIQFYIQPHSAAISFLPGWLRDQHSVWLISIFLLLFSIKNSCAFLVTRAGYNLINKVATRVSAENLVNYQQAAFSEFVQTDSSVYLRKICYQPFEFAQYMLAGLQQLTTQFSLILITITGIMLYNARIFLLLLVLLLPPAVLVFLAIKKRLAATKKSIQLYNELSFKYVLDALKGYVESNIYNRNDFFLKRFVNVRSKFSNALFDSLALQSLPARIIEVIAVLGLFILVIIATWWHDNSNSMLFTIGAFMAAAYKLIPGIVKVINVSGQMKAYELSMVNTGANTRTATSSETANQTKTWQSVQLNNICFDYDNNPILSNFSMAIKPGDFIGITGKSGKGKTTILNILLGFAEATTGTVHINGELVTTNNIRQYWPLFAYVRQQNFLINDTVLKNITLEENSQHTTDLKTAMHISGADLMLKNFPDTAEMIITENGKNISGGQQQRISIARALYKNASIILLDEPFNELDRTSTELLLQHFKQLASTGKAVVMITHDHSSLAYCNKIISLDA